MFPEVGLGAASGVSGEGGGDGRQGDLGVYPTSTNPCAPRGGVKLLGA